MATELLCKLPVPPVDPALVDEPAPELWALEHRSEAIRMVHELLLLVAGDCFQPDT